MSVHPERFPGISQRTHEGDGLKFCMLMYPDHLQNWSDYGHGLLIFLRLAPLKFSERGHIWGFQAFFITHGVNGLQFSMPMCPDHLQNPLTNASDVELWGFLWFVPEQTVQQTIETLGIRNHRNHCDITVLSIAFYWKMICIFIKVSLKFVPEGPMDNSLNGLAPNRGQVFTWTNDGLVNWCIYAPLSHDE